MVYYRVSNATVSIANVENAHHSTRLLAQTTLRNTMGTRHLHEILSERMTISGTMQVSSNQLTVGPCQAGPTDELEDLSPVSALKTRLHRAASSNLLSGLRHSRNVHREIILLREFAPLKLA